jgi:hypothetical protein
VHERCAYAYDFIRGNRDADARATHQNSERIFSGSNGFSNRARKIGIIDRFFRPGPDIIDFVPRRFQISLIFSFARNPAWSAPRAMRGLMEESATNVSPQF